MEKKDIYIFLFEHKSYEEKNISFQLLKYMIEIWENKLNKEKTDELPIVIPLVVYHGKQKWNIKRTLGDLLLGYSNLSPNIQNMYRITNIFYTIFLFSVRKKFKVIFNSEYFWTY